MKLSGNSDNMASIETPL